jgi:hypothetical protein
MRRVSGFLALLIASMLLAACGTSSTSSGSGDWFYHWNCNGDPECLATQPGSANQESGTIDEGPVEAECTQILQFGDQFWGSAATQSCDQNANGGGGGGGGAPTISGVSPAGAIPGTSITITGSNFPSTTTGVTVTIDGVTCTVTSASSTQIVCTIGGMGDFTGPIVVTTSGGSVDSGSFTVANPLYGVGLAESSLGSGLFWAVGANGTLMSRDGSNWIIHPLTITGYLASVTSSSSQTVTVGESGAILGAATTAFTARTSGTTNNLFGLTWNGSVFVALGAAGTILHSTDGATWVAASSPTAQDLISSAWSGSQFVACGHNAAVLTSPDGSTWTLRTATAAGSENLLGAAFGNSTFVLVGNAGTIIYSTNGSTWNATTSHTTNALFGVTWSGTKFVAVGDQGTILTSPDGVNWTVVSTTAANGNVLNAVAYSGGTFVAVGGNGTIIVSSDGTTWTHEAGI